MRAIHVGRLRCSSSYSTSRASSRGPQEESRMVVRRSPEGRTIYSTTRRLEEERIVTVRIGKEDVPDGEAPVLNWGLFRSSRAKWYHPEECSSAGSTLDEASGLMASPMVCAEGDLHFEAMVKVPKKLEPVTLGCCIHFPGIQEKIIPKGSDYMSVPIGMMEGSPSPLGITLLDALHDNPAQDSLTVNFSIVSRTASSMTLFLVRKSPDKTSKGHLDIALDSVLNKTGDIWHIAIEGLKDLNSLCYGWRADGEIGTENDGYFDSRVVLLDPYAHTITPITLPESAGEGSGNMSTGREGFDAYLGCLSSLVEPEFLWESMSNIRLPLEESVIYTIDLQKTASSMGPLLYLAEILDSIVDLGANAILIQGIQSIDGSDKNLPLHYFAVNHRLASDGEPETARQELRMLVQACHRKGVEVMIEMEYCQSLESGTDCSKSVSLRGLDPGLYYREGNLNWGHPVTRRIVLDSLRNWVETFQVDGFVFQKAEAMSQDRDGLVVDNPPLPETLAHDPVLRRCKMVAACGTSDLLPRCGDRGFPHWGVWLEWNRNFHNDTLAYIAEGLEGKLSAMATRVTGSPDIFAARKDAGLPLSLSASRRPSFGLNYGGLIYPQTEDLQLKIAHAKCFLVAALTFQGIPVLPTECLGDQVLCSLVKRLTRIRDKYKDILAPSEFKSPRLFQWHGLTQESVPMWDGGPEGRNFLAFSIRPYIGAERGIYVGFNPHSYEVMVDLPSSGRSSSWRCLVDTAEESSVSELTQCCVQPNCAVVFDLERSESQK